MVQFENAEKDFLCASCHILIEKGDLTICSLKYGGYICEKCAEKSL
jgi:hypothetical protein